MQPAAAPKIDQRKAEDLLYALIKRIPLHLSEWKKEEEIPQERDRALAVADDPRDFGMALLKLAARMGEIVIEQFNRVPEKNFLAFLDLVGVNLLPPRSARAPLTFALAEKAPTDGFVPQGTKVGVAGVEEDVVFETEEDLVVSRASPLRVYSLSPVQDRYTDLQELLAGAVAEGKTILGDAEPTPAWPLIDHILYLGHDRLLALAATADVPVKITMGLFGGTLGQIDWQYHDGKSWRSVGQSTGAASVSFKVPGIREAKVQGYDAQGNLIARPGYWIRAKTAQPLAADPTQLPTISSIEAEVSVKGVSESPELAFFNKLPLDVTKDLFPFGERPKFNDTLYIAWEEAFSKPGAAITIDAALSPAAAFPRPQTRNIKLAWEHWDGPNKKWSAIAETTQAGVPAEVGPYKFTDTTNAFTKDGKVDFLCPTMEPVAVNQEKNYWLRVRILEGGYGEEAKYETTTEEQLKTTLRSADLADAGLTEAQLSRVASSLKKGGVVDTARYIPATFTPPSLKSFAVEYAYTESARSGFTIVSVNDFIYRDVSHELPIQPFVPTDERRPALYIGFDEARPFQGSPLTLFFQVLQPRYGQQAGAEGAGGGISRPVVVWRYWDGEDWARLAVDDETRNFSQGGRVRFIAPYNLSPRVVFGARVLWLKATLEEGDYARSPRLAGIYLNTVWASHGVTLKDQTLGSSNGEPGQSFTFAKAPVLEGEMIEVREASLPSEAARARICAAEGARVLVHGLERELGEQVVASLGSSVDHFNLSAPGDRHYVADRVKGLLLFGDGVRGLIPPPGKDSIRSPLYRSGGGKTGNRAAGLIAELKTTLPFIDAVVNHQASAGGFDQENLEDAMVRGPRLIKSRDRAITKEDFEWLAYQAAGGEIAKARCLPRTRLAAEGLRGNSSGWVTLVVVPETEEPQPLPNEGLIQTVKRYLAQYSLVTLVDQIDVIGPSYVPVAIEATVIPRRIEDAKAVEKRVLENLRAFLHPVKGGSEGQGWEFGKDIYLSEIAAVIQGTEGVDRVQEIVLKTEQGDVRDHVTVPENGLPSSGEHVIRSIGA